MPKDMTGFQKQLYAKGFARGLLKAAMTGAIGAGAEEALTRATSIATHPATRRTMAALGRDIFDAASKGEAPLSSAWRFMFARPHQLNTIYKTMVGGGAPELLEQQFAELGEAAAQKMRFANTVGPVAATAGIAGPLAYAGGHMAGAHNRGEQDTAELANLPIHKRLQYALFPQSMLPPQPKPFYDRIPS